MAGINGKKKGSRNERALAGWWNEWTGLEFARVPASGGLRWQKKDDISGDIICTDPRKSRRFPFSIETKFYKDIKFEQLILGNKTAKIWDFWEQALEDGERSNRVPILYMRYNNMPRNTWFVIVDLEVFKLIRRQAKGKLTHTYFIMRGDKHDVVCLNSDSLLAIKYKEFVKTIKIRKRNGKL